ncbi:MAG: hypothetical protein PHP54_01770 [Clostridia bacterium]|nr:hypothetical protein [Clostridia bacterium]
MKVNKRNKKGISLITLVITIIVVIILAAAVILTLNNNNPINNAKEATFKQDVSTIQDDLNLYIADKYAKSTGTFDMNGLNLTDTTNPKITDEIQSVKESKLNGKVEVQSGKLVFTGNDETEKKWFEEIINQGGTTGGGNTPMIPTEIVAENTKYTDAKGKTAIIPKGFKVSSVATEQIIEDGLVIQDNDENEFVWIPVDNIANFKRVDWPVQYLTVANTPEDENTAEYIAMKASVETNKGYYIARYQAGIPGTTQSVVDNHGTVSTGTIKPVSKQGVGAWNFIAWGANKNTETPGNGAVTVARAMYPKGNTETGVVSTLCYDIQWDTALKFIEKKDQAYPSNSTNKGNYNGTNSTEDTFISIAVTGAHPSFMVNNIYDMAGNVYEWTMAAIFSSSRVYRGGDYNDGGSFNPAGYRSGTTCSSSGNHIGFRPTLYIK